MEEVRIFPRTSLSVRSMPQVTYFALQAIEATCLLRWATRQRGSYQIPISQETSSRIPTKLKCRCPNVFTVNTTICAALYYKISY